MADDKALLTIEPAETPAEEPDYSWPFGKAHRRSRRMMLALALLGFVGSLFFNELDAMGWHLRHGFHYEFHGYKVYVPLTARAWENGSVYSARILCRPGRTGALLFHEPWYNLELNYARKAIALEAQLAEQDSYTISRYQKRVNRRTVMLAGDPLTCFDIQGPWPGSMTRCFRETPGPVTNFSSSPNAPATFEQILARTTK